MMIRVFQIGMGSAGRRRLRALTRNGRVHVAGVADTDASARTWAAETLGPDVPVADSGTELLARFTADVAVVSTPHHLHGDLVVAALERGLHVLCEKPLGTSASVTARCVDAALRMNRVLRPGANHLWLPSVRRADHMLAQGEYGPIVDLEIAVGHGLAGRLPVWFKRIELSGGGALKDNGAHAILLALRWLALDGDALARIDSCRLFFGDGLAVELAADVLMRSARGRSVRVKCRWVGPAEYEFKVRARCHAGQLVVEGPTVLREEQPWGGRELPVGDSGSDSWCLDTDHFLDSVLGLRPVEPKAAHALACACVVEAAYESALIGRMVAV
jgi:predicted dehydrogenase